MHRTASPCPQVYSRGASHTVNPHDFLQVVPTMKLHQAYVGTQAGGECQSGAMPCEAGASPT